MATIETVEQALQQVGQRIQQEDMARQARRALAEGDAFEIRVTVRQARQGGVVSMDARALPGAERLTYIRLS